MARPGFEPGTPRFSDGSLTPEASPRSVGEAPIALTSGKDEARWPGPSTLRLLLSHGRVSRKGWASRVSAVLGLVWCRFGSGLAPVSGGGECQLVFVELQEVVCGVNESPFGPHRGASASSPSAHPAVRLRLREYRLDHSLASSVKVAAVVGVKHSSHVVIKATLPSWPDRLALWRFR